MLRFENYILTLKYLGCIEVFESRGMQVCEEAIKALRKSKKKSQRAILYVSGDALRVSDEISQHLIVDQTIEKVSFCAPDRGHEKGFAYICRDGATRRWMCHAFLAVKESGERLSHAVGCAFAICLEKKQKREREAVQVTYPTEDATFARMSSFRQATLSERLFDPQSTILVEPPLAAGERKSPSSGPSATSRALVPYNESATAAAADHATLRPGAIPRPRASPSLIERQTSLRLFPKLQETSPFKQSLSLRMTEMPPSLQRINRMVNGQTIPEEKALELESPISAAPAAAAAAAAVNNNTTNIAAFLSSPPTTERPSTSPVAIDNATKALPVQRAGSSAGSSDLAFTCRIFEAGDSNPLSSLSDPFSAAPFNPATIQQHYYQQQQQMELKALPNEPFAASTYRVDGFGLQSTDWPASVALTTAAVPPSTAVAAVTTAPAGLSVLVAPEMVAPATRPAPATFGMALFGNSQPLANAHSTPPSVPAVNGQWLGSPSSWAPAPQPPVLLPEPDKITDPFDVRWAERASALAASQLASVGATPAQPSTLCALATAGSGSSASPLSHLPLPDTGSVQTNPFLTDPIPTSSSSLVQIINPGQ
uniref:Protein numb n=2 Tax=Schistocephalus solidus TaxID=70667 RepID=A0A0X3PUL0_SCHSO